VHHVRDRYSFITSLFLVTQKFEKDPHHLCQEKTAIGQSGIDMRRFKKSQNISASQVWHTILTLIPGISHETADHIMSIFPALSDFFQIERESVMKQLTDLQIHPRRRLGEKTAQKILSLLRP
jgi:hypothetical protein